MNKLNVCFLNFWFYFWSPILLLFYLLVMCPWVALAGLVQPGKIMRRFRRAINNYGKTVVRTGWPWIKAELHNCPPEAEGPYILVENHISSFDPFVQGILPFEMVQTARGWALRFPVLGYFARWAGYLDVDNLLSEELLAKGRKLLDEGVSLIFFPEGTRHPDYQIGSFHGTAFRLALESNIPLLPVLLIGTDDKPCKGSFWMHPGKIDFICLDPIMPEDFAGKTAFNLKNEIRQLMIAELQQRGIISAPEGGTLTE